MPGVITTITDSVVTSGVQSATGKWLVVGEAARGSTDTYEVVRNMTEFVAKIGARFTTSPLLYDSADEFFAGGGSVLIVARVVGPSAVKASFTLLDATNASSLKVTADSPGAWANGATGGLTVQVTHPSTGFAVVVAYAGTTVFTTPEFASVAEAVAWSFDNPSWVKLTDQASVAIPKVVAATNLASGADDRGSIVTASWTAALARLITDLGPGQVSAPGISTTAICQAVLDHCATMGRTPILDGPNSVVASDFSSVVTAVSGTGKKRGAVYGPWAVIRGLTPTTTRQIPYSAVQAAMTARSDGNGTLPKVGLPVAADNGFVADSSLVQDLTVHWDKATRDTLNAAGVNAARVSPATNRVQTYGNTTMANTGTEPAWVQMHASRVFMYAQARGNEISEHYVERPLDPDRKTINEYGSKLEAFLEDLRADEQIANDPKTAVDVGLQVNTDTTIAAKELHARMGVKPTGAADTVYLNVGAEA